MFAADSMHHSSVDSSLIEQIAVITTHTSPTCIHSSSCCYILCVGFNIIVCVCFQWFVSPTNPVGNIRLESNLTVGKQYGIKAIDIRYQLGICEVVSNVECR